MRGKTGLAMSWSTSKKKNFRAHNTWRMALPALDIELD